MSPDRKDSRGWISLRLMLPTATAFYGAMLAHLRQRRTRSGTTTSPSANAPAPVQRYSPSMPSDPTRHQDRHQPNARMCLGADKSLRIWKVYRRICHPAADGPTVEEPAPVGTIGVTSLSHEDQASWR